MDKTSWTQKRVKKLFERYRNKYWPGQLMDYDVLLRECEDFLGIFIYENKLIIIDPNQHKKDAQIRSSLLHEMAHAVAGPEYNSPTGHGSLFFEQLEHLLQMKAPIKITLSETTGDFPLLDVIPDRFILCRKSYRSACQRHKIDIETSDGYDGECDVVAIIEEEFYQYGRLGHPWERIYMSLGRKYQFIDLDNQILPWADSCVSSFKERHDDGYRMFCHLSK